MKQHKWDILLWVLVLATVIFSVVQTSLNTSSLAESQKREGTASLCTEQFLGGTVLAASGRMKYSSVQTMANVRLQRSQLKFLNIISQPGEQPNEDEALQEYIIALENYQRIVSLSLKSLRKNPYPNIKVYQECLRGVKNPRNLPPQPPLRSPKSN